MTGHRSSLCGWEGGGGGDMHVAFTMPGEKKKSSRLKLWESRKGHGKWPDVKKSWEMAKS